MPLATAPEAALGCHLDAGWLRGLLENALWTCLRGPWHNTHQERSN